jgi:hypothetical protein
MPKYMNPVLSDSYDTKFGNCQLPGGNGVGNLAIAMRQASQADLTLLPYTLPAEKFAVTCHTSRRIE